MDTDRANGRAASSEGEGAGKQEILRISPFSELPGPSRDALLDLGRLERLPRRHRIAEQGEPPKSLVLIGAGRVKLERVTAARALPLGHRGPGQMVGETAVTGAQGATESAIVLDEVEALTIPIGAFRKLLAADAPVRTAMTAALVNLHRSTEERLVSLLLYGVEARLVSFLLDSCARWGQPHPAGQVIAAPFTHADIALLIGSTRETVTLLLGRLKRSGFIAFERRRVVIRDRAALERRVELPL
jgi:CRP/FNR family transcriptional regulator, cyclic AMP receptor protein